MGLGMARCRRYLLCRVALHCLQIGTPQYMAPEMHAGREYSYAADVWSLGCLLYELCALEPLFQDREEDVVARKVRWRAWAANALQTCAVGLAAARPAWVAPCGATRAAVASAIAAECAQTPACLGMIGTS